MRQYLAAAFLIVIGLVASGCGDTATVNSAATLANLTVDPGTLQPAFSGGVTQYTVDLSNDVTSVTIAAQPSVAGDTVTINNQVTTSSVITLGAAGTTTSVPITVSGSAASPQTYTVNLVRASFSNSLQSLVVSPGTLAPTFNMNQLTYSVDVANNVGSISVTPTVQDPAATVTVNGQPAISGQASTVPLNNPGQSQTTVIPIVVKAQNENEKTYTVTVNRGVSSNKNLSGLTVSPGTLNPTFNANRTSYTVNVASTVTSVTVTPTLQDTTASMTVNGQTNSGQARTIQLSGAGSSTPIIIIVTAQNGTQNVYTVGINRAALGGNNNLSALAVSPGTLDPAFNANTTNYTVDVASTVTSATVTPRLQDTTASMTVNGQATNSGQARTIQLGTPGSSPPPILIVVTAQNGTQKTYTVDVNRDALGGNNNLSGLAVSPGSLSPAFTATRTSYTVSVGSGVDSITVTATKADSNASMTINNQGTNSGQSRPINLGAPGSSTEIDITVTAPNGNSKAYTITVERAAPSSNNNLSALRVTSGNVAQTLTPQFSAGTLGYTVNVATNVTSVTVTATKADSNAVISGDLPTQGQATIQLDGPGISKTVSIIVTAPSGAQKTYTVTINRATPSSNNNLSALSVTPGALSPAFAADTLGYTVNVASDVTSVAISATKADSNAVISGDVPNSGQANIALSGAGTTTSVSIIVTAPDGTSKTYTIDIIRAAPSAPPAPASAPDLIPQDDSGFLPGQDADNITNVNTPRFRVPSPGAGETPNLYVDGSKVDATFDQGANTLRPTTALSDGDHTITSTVTNAGGESSPSPPLPVTIDTIAPGLP
ncbi:MAG TPA: cadherin-like beta sandwich domain-containing protein, partial [Nitrospira sp.]|nr:cadherin-like beta sandwich domain-containing protein [Nitrospira sp.]